MAKAANKKSEDVDISENVKYKVTDPDSKHYLKIDAFYGTTHETAFLNTNGDLVVVNNQNNDGFLGYGKDLKGKTIKIRSRTFADIDEQGVERVRLDYFIDDQSSVKLINKYDMPESNNDAPYLKFTITFS